MIRRPPISTRPDTTLPLHGALPISPETARRSFLRKVPDADAGAPPPAVAKVVADIGELLAGKPVDLLDAPLDIGRVPDFNARVYAVARDRKSTRLNSSH